MTLLKRLSLFLILALGCSLVTAMEEDTELEELAGRIVYDIDHSDQFTETVHAIKNNVDVLDPRQVRSHVLSTITEAYEEACKAKSEKKDKLLDLFNKVLEIGKGHGFFDKLIEAFDLKKSPYRIAQAIKGAYPDLFPEEEEEDLVVEEESSEESTEEEDDEFVYVQPSDDALRKAFAFHKFIAKVNKSKFERWEIDPYQEELKRMVKQLTVDEVLETDLIGRNLLYYVALRYCRESNWYHYNIQWAIRHVFDEVYKKGSMRQEFLNQLNCTYKLLHDTEKVHNELIRDLYQYYYGSNFKDRYKNYKKNPRVHVIPNLNQKDKHEKLCAHHAAELFMAVEYGDDGLSNACEMLKERPYLVHARNDCGVPILYHVLRVAEGCPNKRNGLKAFFNLLLLLKADADLEVQYRKIESNYVKAHYVGNNYWSRRRVDAHWTTEVGPKKALPTVREVLTGEKNDPYFKDKRGYDTRVSQGIANQFYPYLAAFEKNPEAPFTPYPILRGYMPVKVVPVKKLPKAKFDKEAMDKYLNQLDEDAKKEKSFFETYKPTFKSLLWGAVIGGFSYWLCNREDRHEVRRRMRARASR